MGLGLALLTAGTLVLLPAATASSQPDAPSGVAVGAEGTDGALWVQTSQLGTGWHSLGGRIIAAPAIAAVPGTGGVADPLFIGVGTDHQLWERMLDTGWTVFGPSYCVGAPSAVVAPGDELLVACAGPNGNLFTTATRVVPGAGLPHTNRWTNLGGAVAAGPAVTSYNGSLVYFAESPNGHVYYQFQQSGFGSPLTWVPFAAVCSGHLAAGETNSGLIAWFGCRGTDGRMWAGGGTQFPAQLSSRGGALRGGPGLAVDSGPNVFFLAEGTHQAVWIENAATPGWTSLGGQVVGGVAAVGLV